MNLKVRNVVKKSELHKCALLHPPAERRARGFPSLRNPFHGCVAALMQTTVSQQIDCAERRRSRDFSGKLAVIS